MLNKLDELASKLNKIKEKWDAIAKAAKEAYEWQKKAAGGGGGGGEEAPPAQAGIWSVGGHPVRRLDPKEMVLPAQQASIARSVAGGFGELGRLLRGGMGGIQIGPNYIRDDYDFDAKVKRVLVSELGVT